MSRFTVPATGTYVNARDGHRYAFRAGDQIDLALAVDLGMDGASLPAAPAPFSDAQVAYLDAHYSDGRMIHNYLVDGGGENADLIDDGSYAANKLWFPNMGGETLSQEASNFVGSNVIQCVTSGSDWDEGLVIGDVNHSFGPALPAGRYEFGLDLRVTSGAVWCLLVAVPLGPTNAYRAVRLTTHWQRFTIPVVPSVASWPTLSVQVDHDQYPDEPSPLVATIQADNVILTEGSAAIFADGDSDGWTWTGTPHASASYGPRP